MIRQALRWLWRALWGVLLLPWRYRRTFLFLFLGPVGYRIQPGGWRKAWRFWQVKVFARGERVGLQLLDPVSLLWPDRTPYPRMLELEVTNRCHLRCPMCERTYFPADYRHNDLTYDQFVRLMRQFPDLRYVNLTGEGSSFLNPDFPRMLAYCQERDIYTTVIDSFTAMTPEQMRLLITSGVKKVPVSLDAATADTYAKVRVGGDFHRVCRNVLDFCALRRSMGSPTPEIVFRFIFYRDNVQDIPAYPKFISQIGMQPWERDGIDNMVEFAALLEFEQTRNLVVEVDPAVVLQTEASLHRLGLPHAWSHPSHVPSQKRPMRECAAWAEPYVMAGGYVMPCCAVMMSNRRPFLIEHALGNVYEQDFHDIWNSARYRAMRRAVSRADGPVPILCQGCRAFDTTAREARYGVGLAGFAAEMIRKDGRVMKWAQRMMELGIQGMDVEIRRRMIQVIGTNQAQDGHNHVRIMDSDDGPGIGYRRRLIEVVWEDMEPRSVTEIEARKRATVEGAIHQANLLGREGLEVYNITWRIENEFGSRSDVALSYRPPQY